MEQKNTDVKVPLISKIAYGMGDVGCNFSWMFVGNCNAALYSRRKKHFIFDSINTITAPSFR